ncbi:MAG: response regulator [Chloroflexi bacterium]|nr:response regulator [Chloroflexota bacterium]
MEQDRRQRMILVVEDDPAIAEILRIFLDDTGCRIRNATSGREALEVARSEQPDVITLDLALPDIDGQDVLSQLELDPVTSAIPVIVVTGKAYEQKDGERVVAILPKPFDAAALDAAVHRALAIGPGSVAGR